jgi:hypothetical protein
VWGVLGFVPLVTIVAVREWRRLPPFSGVRANYDRLNSCGGVIMSEEAGDMTEWQPRLPQAAVPALKWRGGRTLGILGLAAAFVAVALLLPERLTRFAQNQPLEISQLVEELQTEVQTLEEEKILDEKKAAELDRQLSKLKEDSSGLDPNKTWEALDHIKQSNADAAQQAAEEALSKLTALTQAEAIAAALQMAADANLSEAVATAAALDLATMMKAAKLEEGLLKGKIPAELLSNLDGLSKEEMEKLLRSIQFNKENFGKAVAKLANLRLIDAKLLSQCKKAGKCPNIGELAEFLCQGGTNACDSYCELAKSYCRGGVTRGRGDAPMTWTDGSDEDGAKFKEEALPPSTQLSDAQLVGVSRAAPDLSGDDAVAGHGVLQNASASGGSAHSQVILPRHKQTVQRFFQREER